MIGRIIVVAIVLSGILGGAALYWFQVYAYYERSEGGEVRLTPAGGATPGAVAVEGLTAIDAESSPLRYRACFSHALDPADYAPHPAPEPTNGPPWFDCYDATATAEAMASGEAAPVMGTANLTYGIDRVVALGRDGRGVAWHQINPCGEAVYAGRAPPEGCPPPPQAYRD